MRKNILFAITSAFAAVLFFSACKKDSDNNNNNNGNTTKTTLITSAAWKFDNAKLGSTDVSGYIDNCDKDNIATFLSNGTGTADEGGSKCDPADPQTVSFNWNFQNNESTIHTSSAVFSGNGDFEINTLTETQFVISRDTVLPGIGSTKFIVTMKH